MYEQLNTFRYGKNILMGATQIHICIFRYIFRDFSRSKSKLIKAFHDCLFLLNLLEKNVTIALSVSTLIALGMASEGMQAKSRLSRLYSRYI